MVALRADLVDERVFQGVADVFKAVLIAPCRELAVEGLDVPRGDGVEEIEADFSGFFAEVVDEFTEQIRALGPLETKERE